MDPLRVLVVLVASVLLCDAELVLNEQISGTEDVTPHDDHPPGRAHATLGQFPEAVAVRVMGQFLCSGTVLDANTVLTAAICVALIPNLRMDEVSVVAGSLDRKAGRVVNASEVTTHPQFRYYPQQLVLEHDLAIIRLDSPLTLDGENVSAINLPEVSSGADTYAGQSAVVAGWGVEGRRDSSLLLMNVTISRQEECANFYRDLTPVNYILDAGQMCSSPSADLCIGESGAGLRVIGDDNRPLLIGVAGPAVGCPTPQRPEIYTRVEHYMDWIREHMTPQSSTKPDTIA